MQKLIKANLYRSKLIPISGKLVGRYNQCLIELGFSPTKLTSFSIDGKGWSPEIAEEKKTIHYLNNGEANSHGIIISPLQNRKPVYMPFHSFDREMMKLVFDEYGKKINDITRDSAIYIDFDQNIDVFYEPLDVLKYDVISISFKLIHNLNKVQKEQLELIEEFKQGNNFIDLKYHDKILKSAKEFGDLRSRDLILNKLSYKVNSFYTKAFGGVFVLREFIVPLVVFENKKWHTEAIKDTIQEVSIYHISQPQLIEKLRDDLIISYNLSKIVTDKRYQRIKKYIFSKALKNTQHPIKDILDDEILFKSYLNKIDIEFRKKVMGVEIYLEKLELSNEYKIHDVIDNQFFYALHAPHSSLEINHQDLIWKLLVNIAPLDVLFLYWYDKEAFYTQYKKWNDSMKDWVIETIENSI